LYGKRALAADISEEISPIVWKEAKIANIREGISPNSSK